MEKVKEYAVGIVGMGTVGKGLFRLFRECVIAVYDPYLNEEQFKKFVTKEDIPHNGVTFNSKTEFNRCDLIVVCVPTNENKDGSCETSLVEESLDWIDSLKHSGIVLIKSAVVPSEIQRFVKKYPNLHVVVSPEYLGESKYFTPPWSYPDPTDMKGHTWQVFGGYPVDTSLCVSIFQRKMGVDTTYFQVDHLTAALTKYVENCFFATKVTFCNEIYDICKLYGVDYNTLRETWAYDPRVNKNHTLVFPKDRGFGGKCFPKDLSALIFDAKKNGYKAKLLEAVKSKNVEFRKLNEE